MKRPTTIYDIATAAQVSPSTVSRAFTRPGRLNAATVAAVLEVAERLGYSPNNTARSLSTGRTGNLAMVVPNIANPFFTDFMRAFHAAALARQYSVFLIDTDEASDVEAHRLSQLATQIDGVALVAPRIPDMQLQELVADGNYVVVNRAVSGVPTVRIDSRRALQEAVSELARLGHERIVYVRGPAGGYSDKLRRRIVRGLCARHSIELLTSSAQPDDALSAVTGGDLIESSRATAALVHSDSAAIALLTQCRVRDISVPDRLSLIGHDDIGFSSVVYPRLSTIDAKTREVGRRAADALIAVIEARSAGQAAPIGETVIEAEFVRRESTAPAPVRARP